MSAGEILVCNCGSSSVKLEVFAVQPGEGRPAVRALARAQAERIGGKQSILKGEIFDSGEGGGSKARPLEIPEDSGGLDHQGALERLTGQLTRQGVFAPGNRRAIGHRVVHGGSHVSRTAVVDAELKKVIRACEPFAPLHNPVNLLGIEVCSELFHDIPQFAVFDTAFHATLPPSACTYALPAAWREKHGLRRYGFHGSSHQYVSRRFAQLKKGQPEDFSLITCHLGNGASLCAIERGKSVETSMGFTPLEGLVMGTRCGDLDPAVVLYLLEKEGLSVEELDHRLNKESGLRGLCGTNDFREILSQIDKNSERAEDCRLARDVFAHRVRKYIGAYLASLSQTQAIVFTAGIGENSPEVRRAIIDKLGNLGLELDEAANQSAVGGREAIISKPGSAHEIWVIPTDEEKFIAEECLARLELGAD